LNDENGIAFDIGFDLLRTDGPQGYGQRTRNESIMIRSGDKIAVANYTGGKQEVTFVEVGTNIDCRVLSETPSELNLSVSSEISTSNGANLPVISQTKWNSSVVVWK
jgi:hypothetical protein